MEHLSSIIEAVKERLRSPFIFSFLISWLIWNWPVTMAFVWFRSDKLDIVQLINNSATGWWSTLVPLISAIVWTFGVPFLSIGMRMFNAKIVKWSNDRVFKISEQSKVSFEHYFSVLHENTTKGKQLDEMIEKQTTLRDQRNTAMSKVEELQENLKGKETEISGLKNEQENIHKLNADYIRETVQSLQAKNELELNRKSSEWSLKTAALQDTIDKERHTNNKIHDASVIDGNWIFEKTNLTVFIGNRRFIVNGEPDAINMFDNHSDGEQIRFVVTRANFDENTNVPFATYFDLKMVDNNRLVGRMNEKKIALQRINPEKQLVSSFGLS